jgi:DNA-binding NtrC family response regulator
MTPVPPGSNDAEQFFSDFPTLEQLERRYIQWVLEKTEGNTDKTAQILGIDGRTLYRKEREYGLISPENSFEAGEAGDDEIEAEYSKE